MDEPDAPVEDRERAIRAVESAWADGRLREVDRDLRVDALRRAGSPAEVEALVRDLSPATYQQLPAEPVPPDPPEAPDPPAQPAPVRAAVASAPTPGIPARWAVVSLLAVVAVLVAGGIGLAVSLGGSDVDLPGVSADEVDLFTPADFADLLDDLEDERGTAELFSAVLYPTYASLDAPVDATSQRKQSYFWDGDLDEPGSKGTTDDARFDLSGIDHPTLVTLLEDVRGRVEDPTTWYAIVHAPREGDLSVYQVYASNEYGETAYLLATADGTVTYRSEPST